MKERSDREIEECFARLGGIRTTGLGAKQRVTLLLQSKEHAVITVSDEFLQLGKREFVSLVLLGKSVELFVGREEFAQDVDQTRGSARHLAIILGYLCPPHFSGRPA